MRRKKSGAGIFPHRFGGKSHLSRKVYIFGDLMGGIACISNEASQFTHINIEGPLLHEIWFKMLDVYHEGFATTKYQNGWCHID